MENPLGKEPVAPSHEERAQHALEAYHERRRRRRASDTYFGSGESLSEQILEVMQAEELAHRRSELLEDAREYGLPESLAALLYDVALEEGVEPALALEIVRSGLAVQPPSEGISNGSRAPATDPYLPSWMFPADPPDRLLRERALRLSLRRFRSLLEESPDLANAFLRFAVQPDVGLYGY